MKQVLKTHGLAAVLFAVGIFVYAGVQLRGSVISDRLEVTSSYGFDSLENLNSISTRLSQIGYPISDQDYLASVLALIDEASDKYQLEREILLAVALVESGLDPKSLSSKGAVGMFQILPTTAEWLKKDFLESLSENDPLRAMDSVMPLYDPRMSTLMGAFYLARLKEQFDQRLHLALAAYNVGPGALRRAISQGDLKGTEYIFRVYQIRNALRGV